MAALIRTIRIGKSGLGAIVQRGHPDRQGRQEDIERDQRGLQSGVRSRREEVGAKFQSKGKTPLIRPDGGNKGILIDCDTDMCPDSLDADDVKGCYLMNLKRKNKPGVVAVQDGALVHLGEEDIQGGDYCQVTLSMYPYNHPQGGMGISKGLNNVCKMSDGEPLGTGSASAESDFADMASASAFGSGDNDEDPFA